MCNLKHTQPCSDCPWRKDSIKGWLGGFPIDWFVERIYADVPLNCHNTLGNIDGMSQEEIQRTKPLCAGALIQYRNMVKLPRDPELAAAVTSVEQSDKVFAHPHLFKQHHGEFDAK